MIHLKQGESVKVSENFNFRRRVRISSDLSHICDEIFIQKQIMRNFLGAVYKGRLQKTVSNEHFSRKNNTEISLFPPPPEWPLINFFWFSRTFLESFILITNQFEDFLWNQKFSPYHISSKKFKFQNPLTQNPRCIQLKWLLSLKSFKE